MNKEHAYRNVKLCTKDCLCLFVCPSGATDTETGQIDSNKCIGCGACARSCPSRAITMIPNEYPTQQIKTKEVVDELFKLSNSKIEQMRILKTLINNSKDEREIKLLKALYHSNKVIVEDFMREAGYMLPESKNVHKLLEYILEDSNIDKEKVQKLINNIKTNN